MNLTRSSEEDAAEKINKTSSVGFSQHATAAQGRATSKRTRNNLKKPHSTMSNWNQQAGQPTKLQLFQSTVTI